MRGVSSRNWVEAVYRLADDVEHSAERRVADGYGDRRACVGDFSIARETGGILHGDAARTIESEVLRDLERQRPFAVLDVERIPDGREPDIETDVNDRSDNLCNCSFGHITFSYVKLLERPRTLRRLPQERPPDTNQYL